MNYLLHIHSKTKKKKQKKNQKKKTVTLGQFKEGKKSNIVFCSVYE